MIISVPWKEIYVGRKLKNNTLSDSKAEKIYWNKKVKQKDTEDPWVMGLRCNTREPQRFWAFERPRNGNRLALPPKASAAWTLAASVTHGLRVSMSNLEKSFPNEQSGVPWHVNSDIIQGRSIFVMYELETCFSLRMKSEVNVVCSSSNEAWEYVSFSDAYV